MNFIKRNILDFIWRHIQPLVIQIAQQVIVKEMASTAEERQHFKVIMNEFQDQMRSGHRDTEESLKAIKDVALAIRETRPGIKTHHLVVPK